MAVSGPFRDIYTYYGLAADDKPGAENRVLAGSKFVETDTGKEYAFLNGAWVELSVAE